MPLVLSCHPPFPGLARLHPSQLTRVGVVGRACKDWGPWVPPSLLAAEPRASPWAPGKSDGPPPSGFRLLLPAQGLLCLHVVITVLSSKGGSLKQDTSRTDASKRRLHERRASCPRVMGTVSGNAPQAGGLSFPGSGFSLPNALQLATFCASVRSRLSLFVLRS